MAERMEITKAKGGILIYRVYDPRLHYDVVAGYYDTNTALLHKFCDKESMLQHKVNGKWLEGFGVQENVFKDVCERGCTAIVVHYAPNAKMHAAQVEVWERIGLLASYSGLQRFLGIMTLAVTKRIKEAGKNGKPALSLAEIQALERDGKQMTIEPDVVPAWFSAVV